VKVKFESVVDGINRYLDKEIYANLNDLQEFLARLAVGRINQNSEAIKAALMNNGFARTLCLVDSEGMVEIDSLCQDIKKEIDRKGCIQFDVPMIGKITFRSVDVDVIRDLICGR
jgi:hypothetical protein